MADNLDNSLPPEYMAEIDAANKKRMIAQLLQKQALGFQGAPTGGRVAAKTSPVAWLANAATGYLGASADSAGAGNIRNTQNRASADQTKAIQAIQALTGDEQLNAAQASPWSSIQKIGQELFKQKNSRFEKAMGAADKTDPNAAIRMGQTGAYPTSPVVGPTTSVNGQIIPAGQVGDYRDKFKLPKMSNGDLYQETEGTGQVRKLDNAPKVSVGGASVVLPKAQAKGVEHLATSASAVIKDLGERATSSKELLGTLAQMTELDQKGILSGVSAPPAAWLTNLAQSAGVAVDDARLANTENYSSIANEAVQQLISRYGGNKGVTKEEAAAIKQVIPQITHSPAARKQLVAILSNAANRSIAKYADAYPKFIKAMQTDNFEGFDLYDVMAPGVSMPTLPTVPANAAKTTNPKGWEKLTPAEQAEYRKLKGQ